MTTSSLLLPIAIAAVAQVHRRSAIVTVSALLLIPCGLSAALLLRHPVEEPWAQALGQVQQTSRPGDRLLFFAAEGELVYDYLVQQNDWDAIPAAGVPHDFRLDNPPRVQLPIREASDLNLLDDWGPPARSRLILIRAHDGLLDKAGLLDPHLAKQWRHTQTRRWRNITVEYYERRST